MRFTPAFLLCLLAVPTWAQVGGPDSGDPVLTGRIAAVEPAQAKMGETVVVKVEVQIPDGWHIYSVSKGSTGAATTFTVRQGPFAPDGAPREPKPEHHREVYGNGMVEEYDYHVGKVVFEVPLIVTGDAKPGDAKLVLNIHSMLCTMEACMPEADLELTAAVKILEGGQAKATAETVPAPPVTPPRKKPNLAAFLFLAMTTGLVTLITPCVFPMIPITISFFTKQASGGRGGTAAMAFAYGAGIVVSYTAIGFIVSLVLGEDGGQKFAGSPWVNIVICAIFVLFALSLFGWFELTLPGGLTNALSAQGKSGLIGALLLGLTFAITAFTCAAPFAASLLAFAVQGERAWALLGFLVYSGTMAVPFVLLGLFPTALKKLPKSGGWLNSVKVVMGFIELAAACKFLANADSAWNWEIVSRSGVLALWTACGVAAGLYLLNVFRLEHDDPVDHIGVPRMLWGLLFLSLAGFTASGLAGRHLGVVESFLPLPEKNGWIFNVSATGGTKETEYDSYSAALKAGKQERKPIFLEFTAFN